MYIIFERDATSPSLNLQICITKLNLDVDDDPKEKLTNEIEDKVVPFIFDILRSRYINRRIVLDLDNPEKAKDEIEKLPKMTYAELPSINVLSIQIRECEILCRLSFKGIRLAVSKRVPCNSFEIYITKSTLVKPVFDVKCTVHVINSRCYEMYCMDYNVSIDVKSNSLVEVFSDIPLFRKGDYMLNAIHLYPNTPLDLDDREYVHELLNCVATFANRMQLDTNTKIFIVNPKTSIVNSVLNPLEVTVEGDDSILYTYCKPAGIINKYIGPGVAKARMSDTIKVDCKNTLAKVLRTGFNDGMVARLNTKSNYDNAIDITNMVTKRRKELDGPMF